MVSISDASPLWPARLHHLRLDSGRPEALIAFYRDGLCMAPYQCDDGLWELRGHERRLLIGSGQRRTIAYAAFALRDASQLEALRQRVLRHGKTVLRSPTPLFAEDAFALRDPDGQLVVFGVARETSDARADALPARLQHVVVTSSRLAAMVAFYGDVLGFRLSDRVGDDPDAPSACFLRSDPEHHSFAVFRAEAGGLDHHAYETGSWNDIRDWADHFATLRVPLWWGPGRHGAGNNLFFMVEDPDGNKVELSAELEHMPYEMEARWWPADGRAINLWGSAWDRA